MSDKEVLYADGSTSTFKGGGSFHAGNAAVIRYSLISARMALRTYIRSEGKFQVTHNGAQNAIKNLIEPMTGKKYKRSMAGKVEALVDCDDLIIAIETGAVVWADE